MIACDSFISNDSDDQCQLIKGLIESSKSLPVSNYSPSDIWAALDSYRLGFRLHQSDDDWGFVNDDQLVFLRLAWMLAHSVALNLSKATS